MSEFLKNQLLAKMEAKGLTINALERSAGVTRSAARNIIQGFSKKPSAEILKALAGVLECSIEDLVGNPHINPLPLTLKGINSIAKGETQWDEKLFIDTIKTTANALSEHNKELKFENIISLAAEVYKYSLNNGNNVADKNFAKWLVGKSFYKST